VYGLRDGFIVSHSGNMGVKQGLHVVLEAAALARIAYPELLFLLVGDGAVRPMLQEHARRIGADNVIFVPLLDLALFRDMLAASDVCLVSQQRTVADIVFPSKMLTLLSAGRPLVASVNEDSEVARVLRDAGAGIRAEPEDPEALLASIMELRTHPEHRAKMGASGRVYSRQHWEKNTALGAFESSLFEAVYGSRAAESDEPELERADELRG
jgi:colanic acid biosynthesis glycosyl transferase WcaI